MAGSPWLLLSSSQWDRLIARACNAFDIQQLQRLPHVSPDFIQGLTSLIRSKPKSIKISPLQEVNDADTVKATNAVGDLKGQAPTGSQLPLNTYQYLIKCVADISPEEMIGRIKRVQVTDCGGQPEFHEILPIFIRGPTLYLFVFKLNEALSSCPQVCYYDNGKPVGTSYSSTESVEQLLEHCLRVVRSQKAVAKEEAAYVQPATTKSRDSPIAVDNARKLPRIMIIGTHKDKEGECETENREAKNEKLVQMLLPEFREEIIYFRFKPKKELIYALNARFPGEAEEKIADDIRSRASTECSIEVQIPLQWHALEVVLEKLANSLDRLVLTKKECFRLSTLTVKLL